MGPFSAELGPPTPTHSKTPNATTGGSAIESVRHGCCILPTKSAGPTGQRRAQISGKRFRKILARARARARGGPQGSPKGKQKIRQTPSKLLARSRGKVPADPGHGGRNSRGRSSGPSRSPQERPKRTPGSSKRDQESGSLGGRPQDGQKTVPRRLKIAPRWPKTAPRGAT